MLLEDDENLNRGIALKLQKEGYQVFSAFQISEAEKLFDENRIDLVISDITLPDGNGLEFCRKIRNKSKVFVLFLTAMDSEIDMVNGYDAGADDYITKPFSMPILVRKIGAVLRRSSMIPEQEHQTITYKNLVLDMDSYTAVVDDVSFDLTQREFEVLRELLLNQGRVLTRQNLLDKLWKYDFYGDERVVDTHIKNLRKKLGIDFIQTIRGVGYKIDKEN